MRIPCPMPGCSGHMDERCCVFCAHILTNEELRRALPSLDPLVQWMEHDRFDFAVRESS